MMRFMLLCFVLIASIPGVQSSEKTYVIGDRGPAGGIVFYDKGVVSDGWRYLEAAPTDQGTRVMWDNEKRIETGADGTGIGTGKANTVKIVTAQGAGKYAASLCDECTEGGKDDWFLPSKDELELMFDNLHKKGLGGFAEDYYYSSSESSESSAWDQWFRNGFKNRAGKYNALRVRAIRSF